MIMSVKINKDKTTGWLPAASERTAPINQCSSQPDAGKASVSSLWNMY